MKKLISPPIQWLLWLGGLACLALAAWNITQLRLADEARANSQGVSVHIPDAKALEVPGINTYHNLLDAPLFWEARSVPVAPAPVKVAENAPPPAPMVKLDPPQGKLVGIVDLGEKRYAVVRGEEKNLSLYPGDDWEGWKVEAVMTDKVMLSAGPQSQEIRLIADFAAPAENQQVASARKKQQQREAALARQRARQQMVPQLPGQGGNTQDNQADSVDIPAIEPVADNQQVDAAGVAEPASPVMSIKEALVARQRLMASRWGATDNQGGQGQ